MLPDANLDHHVNKLLDKIQNCKNINFKIVKEAIEFGKKAHEGQSRKSGERFFIHPVRVAAKAMDYNLDLNTIVASILHDVIEDAELPKQKEQFARQIREKFGETVYTLVEALTKVEKNQNLTLFKILKLGSIDFRVILIKLLDRLDNLSDLKYLIRRKQRRICHETAAIYSELANGLGLIEIEEQFNDLIFQSLYSKRYKRVSKQLNSIFKERSPAINKIVSDIKKNVQGLMISVKPKYNKPHEFLFSRQEIVKVLSHITIKTYTPTNCYEVLGRIHTNFRSIPLQICDYISNPKANGWRGISTQVIVNGEKIQIYIVTEEYHEKNRKGIIPLINEEVYRSENYREFLELYTGLASDNIRIEDVLRYSKEKTIQTLTPNGDIIELRHGATILDFAFVVHSELGLRSAGGIIDNVRYPRNKILENGMVVKIIKADSILAEEKWLDEVVMLKSKRVILKYLKKTNPPKADSRQKTRNLPSGMADAVSKDAKPRVKKTNRPNA